MARVMEGEFDVRSHVCHYIVAQGNGVSYDLSDVFLVVGRMFAFPAVNIEIVQLVKRHEGLCGFRAVDRSVIAILVEEGEYSAVVKVGVRYDYCVQLFQVKFVSIESWVCRSWVLGSRVYSTV